MLGAKRALCAHFAPNIKKEIGGADEQRASRDDGRLTLSHSHEQQL